MRLQVVDASDRAHGASAVVNEVIRRAFNDELLDDECDRVALSLVVFLIASHVYFPVSMFRPELQSSLHLRRVATRRTFFSNFSISPRIHRLCPAPVQDIRARQHLSAT